MKAPNLNVIAKTKFADEKNNPEHCVPAFKKEYENPSTVRNFIFVCAINYLKSATAPSCIPRPIYSRGCIKQMYSISNFYSASIPITLYQFSLQKTH
jgi:hypothetical protein